MIDDICASGLGAPNFATGSLRMKQSAAMPSQTVSAAKLLTSGRRPCESRVSVDALTPDSAATSFQVSRRERRWASIAACNAITSKR